MVNVVFSILNGYTMKKILQSLNLYSCPKMLIYTLCQILVHGKRVYGTKKQIDVGLRRTRDFTGEVWLDDVRISSQNAKYFNLFFFKKRINML